jgi:hypothetical protein
MLRLYTEEHGPLSPPVNVEALGEACSVLKIESRHLIPEGVIGVVPGGFEIYLQDNFLASPAAVIRQRFTLAHELCHTFFYDVTPRAAPTLSREVPPEATVEHLCHIGAGQLLIPDSLLSLELRRLGTVSTAAQVLELAGKFQTSPETTMRRVQEFNSLSQSDSAVILVNSALPEHRIMATCVGQWLLTYSHKTPKIASKLEDWLAPLLGPSGTIGPDWQASKSQFALELRKVNRPDAKSSYFIEVRRCV